MIFALLILLLIITYSDIKTKIIYDGLTLFGILVFLNWQCFTGNIWMSVIGLTVGVFSTFVLNQIGKSNLGGGDAKSFGLIGSVIGWQVIYVLILSKIICWGYRKGSKNYEILPFAPFILIAFLGVILSDIVIFYSRM